MVESGDLGHVPGLGAELRQALRGRPLVIVSNREPYVHRRTARGLEVERPAGGLVAALDPVLRQVGGAWVAWGSGDADFEVTDEHGRVAAPPEASCYTLHRVRLSRSDVAKFYHGYANQALWPLCHMATDKARFARRFWRAYRAVNERFAEATLRAADGDAVIWLHDYHLALVPRFLRERRPEAFLMHFWHIPWPSWDVLRICPQRGELLDGLLASDLLGLQLPRHVENFLDCAERELGAVVDPAAGTVVYRGRQTLVAALPISIDATAWQALAASRACQRWMAHLRRRFRLLDRQMVVGVDRLDYTKGLPERLRALDLFFRRWPAFLGRVVFVQKAAPSRTRIRAYRELQERVEAEIVRINRQYGTAGWQPIVYIPRALPAAGMAALYRLADVCLVTSLLDGMNLVAKEFVACQEDLRGVLVLSELAGAIEEAPWSVGVNPYDPEGMAEALARALTMPSAERARRMQQLRAQVAYHDVYRWMAQHVHTAARLLDARTRTGWLFAHLETVRAHIRARARLVVVVDFDGTLAPIVGRPEDAVMAEGVRDLLATLHDPPRSLVAVISGRGLADLRARVGHEGLLYAGNHGLELSGPAWGAGPPAGAALCGLIARCAARLRRRLAAVPGVVVEDKGASASVHLRLAPREAVERIVETVLDEVGGLPPGQLEVRRGKMVLEIRPAIDWDKGSAVRALLQTAVGPDWPARAAVVYVGDDQSDEDAFAAVGTSGITVRVGTDAAATAARYRLRDPDEVRQFLATLARWRAEAVLDALPGASKVEV
ncbi:MAG: bifunctional alpha,alpha-trehalose-phosphate synthase (UDP-forming)/trehalose-phosphatase [Armatimonadota bacterium]|nr:bifunctional alpha,alpha-trehalose-phosphate synthase (UDP-forming)/trehalose-phosphatase [Armatimonadota bacterium]